MDPNWFASFTQSLHDPRSRRGAFAALGGGTLGLLGLADTAAKNCKKIQDKKKRKKCLAKAKDTTNPTPPGPVVKTFTPGTHRFTAPQAGTVTTEALGARGGR